MQICSLCLQAQRYREAVLTQFSECNRAILRSATINCSLSGSTVVTALVQARTIIPHCVMQQAMPCVAYAVTSTLIPSFCQEEITGCSVVRGLEV